MKAFQQSVIAGHDRATQTYLAGHHSMARFHAQAFTERGKLPASLGSPGQAGDDEGGDQASRYARTSAKTCSNIAVVRRPVFVLRREQW